MEEEISLFRNRRSVNRGREGIIEEETFHVPFLFFSKKKLCRWQKCFYCYKNGSLKPSEVLIVTCAKLCASPWVPASRLPGFWFQWLTREEGWLTTLGTGGTEVPKGQTGAIIPGHACPCTPRRSSAAVSCNAALGYQSTHLFHNL